MKHTHTPEQINFWHATSHAFTGGARALENRRAAFQAEFPGVPVPGDAQTAEDHAPNVRWSVTLKQKLKSQNNFKHWRERYTERLRLQGLLRATLHDAGHKADPIGSKQRITITRVLSPRERLWDDGNGMGGSVKQLVDALKRLGWFHDDSPKWLEVIFKQDDSERMNPGTRIALEEIQ